MNTQQPNNTQESTHSIKYFLKKVPKTQNMSTPKTEYPYFMQSVDETNLKFLVAFDMNMYSNFWF